MRTAAICPTCAVYYNAACVLYDGVYLANLGVNTLDAMDVILGKINSSLPPKTGHGNPTSNALFIGQFYIDVDVPRLWIGLTAGIPNWGLIGVISTTTTTTTIP